MLLFLLLFMNNVFFVFFLIGKPGLLMEAAGVQLRHDRTDNLIDLAHHYYCLLCLLSTQ